MTTAITQIIGCHDAASVGKRRRRTRGAGPRSRRPWRRGHEPGRGRRRSLVDVGRPHVERHRRDLEAEADEEQRRARRAARRSEVRTLRARKAAISAEVRRARGAVGEGDAVDEDRRGERAEDEVLHRRLADAASRAGRTRRARRGDREDLEAEEDEDQVVRRRHEHRAGAEIRASTKYSGPPMPSAPQVSRRRTTRATTSTHGQQHEDMNSREAVDVDRVRRSRANGPCRRRRATARATRRAPRHRSRPSPVA